MSEDPGPAPKVGAPPVERARIDLARALLRASDPGVPRPKVPDRNILGAPITGFRTLTVRGAAGNDVILAGFPTNAAYGEGDNDIVAGGGAGFLVTVDGGSGVDDVETWGSTTDELLVGGIGDDCLWDQNGRINNAACDAGSDTMSSLFQGTTSNCENTSGTCCGWAHLAGGC